MNGIKEAMRQINMNLTMNKLDTKVYSFLTSDENNIQPTVIANLAMMYAQAGEKVLIVDTNFRKDVFSDAFKLSNTCGLSDYLSDSNVSSNDIVRNIYQKELYIVTSGRVLNEQTDFLLGDPRFSELIKKSKNNYDKVFINTPIYSKNDNDWRSIVDQSDGIIIVTNIKQTKKRATFEIVNYCRNSGVNILGYISASEK